MNPSRPTALSRRDAIKTLGAGAALIGLSSVLRGAGDEPASSAAPAAAAIPGTPAVQPFTLPELGYAYAALEPHIDARTMELHHTKHHQAYINNANHALADYPDLRKLTGEQILHNLAAVPEKIRGVIRNNVGGHVNHSFFWRAIGPNGGGAPSGELASAIDRTFGSFDAFRKQFGETALKVFGSGWAWLSVGSDGVLQIHTTANQDSPLGGGAQPVLGLDVWEHAYYLHYQNRRVEYIAAFWNVVNWTQAAANYHAALNAV